MKNALYFKFLLAYVILGVMGILTISTLGSSLIQHRILDNIGESLYKEAISIASYQADADYSDASDIEESYNNLKSLSNYQDARIMITNSSGVILLDTGLDFTASSDSKLEHFDPSSFGTDFYQTGHFYDYFDSDMINVMVPITQNLTTKGYVSLHTPQSTIIENREDVLGPVYIIFMVLFIISLMILGLFSFSVYRPLKKITEGANEYAAGNLDYNIPVDTDDEMGYLATTLNYMSNELDKMGDYQHKFVANVSHDFRSPLTSIKGYVEAIMDGTIPPEMQEKYLKIVVGETERLEKLTKSLLTLDKLDSKGRPIHIASFDINSTIKNTAASFEGTCRKKKITIELHLEMEKLFVSADIEQIQQVLYNLIDNAIKFSLNDSIIKVETSEKHGTVFVSVKDSGVGISKQSINKIWDRFYKQDSSRGKDRKGTGLGLSIVKEIITAHNQNINVISTEGVGTEFIFTLEKTRNV
ncbi:MAG: HAMP domain-containing histidine kinase [Clostridia bacterium]|nr:HAMP domain-containing histidine kinase [Clostridia bacterium]NCC43608.1 HAMP domain-containing histidine kinase [Clostridia bacterium]